MKHTDSPNSDPFPDEVKVDFHMLGTLMLNGVGGEIDCADVVAVDDGGRSQRMMQLLQKLLQPSDFSDAVGNRTVFSLGAGP